MVADGVGSGGLGWLAAWERFRWAMRQRDVYIARRGNWPSGHGFMFVPWWGAALWYAIGLPAFAAYQAAIDGPLWVLDLFGGISDRVAGLVEAHGTPYRWNAPITEGLGEIGFHSIADGSHERNPMRVFVTQSSGPAIYDVRTATPIHTATLTTSEPNNQQPKKESDECR